jgi:hypothetical protein
MFTCIGKRKDHRGRPESCTATSETPTNPARPEWGYLCPTCLGTQYGRPQISLDLLDLDKPNAVEFEPCELSSRGHDETEQDEIDNLRELDLS